MRTRKTFMTRWLDEAWRGRETELVTIPEIAKMAKVDPRTVNSWVHRSGHFPAPVKEETAGPGPTRYFVGRAVAEWLAVHRGKTVDLDAFAGDLDREIVEVEQSLAHLVSMRDQIRAALNDIGE